MSDWHPPSYCPLAVGGYVQGKNGPVGAGLRQMELFIGVQHIHVDFSATGHVAHSWHHCGLAADIDPLKWIWDYLFPVRREIKMLFGPWGLYDMGTKFFDAGLQADHETHIHLGLNMSASGVSILWPKLPNGRLHVPGGAHPAPRPKIPRTATVPGLEQAWRQLSDSLAHDVPKSVRRVISAREGLHDFFTG